MDDDFFCSAAGRKRKRDSTQPGGALLRRTLLVKGWSLGAVHESLEDDRTVPNSSERSRRNRQIVANQVEFCNARLREKELVRIRDTDFTPVNRQQLAGFRLGH